MSETYSQHESLLDGEIFIFVLASSKKGRWQVRFKNPLAASPAYIRKSTGHTSKALATARALEIFNEYQGRALLKLKSGKLTIAQMMDSYSVKMSTVMRSAARSFYNTYWKGYFSGQDLSVITSEQITEYFEWKVSNRDSIRERVRPGRKASEDSLSADNLKLERNCLAWLFRAAYANNRVARMPEFPQRFHSWDGVHSLPRNRRRGKFDKKKHYQGIIKPELRRLTAGLLTPEWKPVLLDQDEPWCPDSNPWISRAKKDGIAAGWQKNKDAKDFVSKKSRYPSSVFWFSSQLLIHTGMRVSELVKLRHRDIRLIVDSEDGYSYTAIHIDPTVSKVGKQRTAFCDNMHDLYVWWCLYKSEIEYHFNIKPEPDDFMFPQPGDYGVPRKFLYNLYGPRLKAMGLHEQVVVTRKGHKVKVNFSAYSFRSYFISEKLKQGMNVYNLSKLVGVSIKVLVSTYDYNENWSFRHELTQHSRGEYQEIMSDEQREMMAEMATEYI